MSDTQEPADGDVIPPTDARWSPEFTRYYGHGYAIRTQWTPGMGDPPV